jgi:exodeoxyribonuclease-5
MILTDKQAEGLKIAVERYKRHEPYTVISGYAGSGKSTLVTFIIAALGLDPENIAYCAFCGKAAEVLREKGNPNAKTAHKILYKAKQNKDGTYSFYPKEYLDDCPALVIVDEVSMLPKQMWNLLLSHGVHVIALGDPAQLPPINKKDDNHILDNPHIFLDEVMRQAKESDIIVTSMNIREGKVITPFRGNDTQIVRSQDLVTGMYNWADEILTATNKTRIAINNFVRAEKGYPANNPVIGEKIICLKNNWDLVSQEKQDPLVNGSICTIDTMRLENRIYVNKKLHKRFKAEVLVTDLITSSGDMIYNVPIDYKALCTGTKTFTPQEEYMITYAGKGSKNPPLPIEFNYGYAITTHRAQGSQWDKVLVIEESFPYDKEEHRRWLYTAVTRATKKLTLVLK